MSNDSFRASYEELLKQNTLLHDKIRHITQSSIAACTRADMEISQLNLVVNEVLERAVSLVRESYPASGIRDRLETAIACLAPLRISK